MPLYISNLNDSQQLSLKVLLNQILEEKTSNLKFCLLGGYALSHDQSTSVKEAIAEFYARSILKLIEPKPIAIALEPATEIDPSVKSALLEIFKTHILHADKSDSDMTKILESIATTNFKNSTFFRRLGWDGKSLLTKLANENHFDKRKLPKALSIFERNRLKALSITNKVSQRESQKAEAQSAKDRKNVFKMILIALVLFIGAYYCGLLGSPLSQILTSLAIMYITRSQYVMFPPGYWNNILDHISLDITFKFAKESRAKNEKKFNPTKSNNTFDMPYEFAVNLLINSKKQQPAIVEIEPERLPNPTPKRHKLYNTEIVSSVTPTHSETKLPDPQFFDERFSNLNAKEHLVVIDPDNLGKSARYFGLWNKPRIESECKNQQDIEITQRLHEVFLTGKLAKENNTSGIKLMKNLGLFEVKIAGRKERVYADDSETILKDDKKLLVFNTYDKKGKH